MSRLDEDTTSGPAVRVRVLSAFRTDSLQGNAQVEGGR